MTTCTVGGLVDLLTEGFGGRPGWRLESDVSAVPETATLRLDASLAAAELGWKPRLGLTDGVRWTVDWYRAHAAGEDVRALTLRQLAAYEERT